MLDYLCNGFPDCYDDARCSPFRPTLNEGGSAYRIVKRTPRKVKGRYVIEVNGFIPAFSVIVPVGLTNIKYYIQDKGIYLRGGGVQHIIKRVGCLPMTQVDLDRLSKGKKIVILGNLKG